MESKSSSGWAERRYDYPQSILVATDLTDGDILIPHAISQTDLTMLGIREPVPTSSFKHSVAYNVLNAHAITQLKQGAASERRFGYAPPNSP